MKIWTTKTADQKFSLLIRQRDILCVRCRRATATDCSHFYERHHSATRYHPENCDGACRRCHDFWHANRPDYEIFKKSQLGPLNYLALQRLAWSTMKRETAIINLIKSLTNAKKNIPYP